MTQRRSTLALMLLALAVGSGEAEAQTRSISGVVTVLNGPIAKAGIDLTSYSDKACLDLANKKEPSPAEQAHLTACRKEKVRSVSTSADGKFQIPNLVAAWYSMTVTWTATSRPPFGGFSPITGDLVGSYLRDDGTVVITVAPVPFEVKGGARVQKDVECK